MPAQDGFEPQPGWPFGPVNGVAVQGGHAYFGSGSALVVADISDPSNPSVTGSVALPDVVEDVAVVGKNAYVAARSAGLRVVDVSNLVQPAEVGFVDTPGTSYAVAVTGSTVLVADEAEGLRVVDASDPASPQEVGFVPAFAVDVDVLGDLALVADGSDGLRLMDVSVPGAPVEVGLFPADFVTAVSARAGHAYVSALTSVLVIDVSDPTQPVQVDAVALSGVVGEVAISGDLAYVSTGYSPWGLSEGLVVLDLSTPADPQWLTSVLVSGTSLCAAAGGDLVLLGAVEFLDQTGQGLVIVDVSTPAAPEPVGTIAAAGPWPILTVAGDTAVVGALFYGLWNFDLNQPPASPAAGVNLEYEKGKLIVPMDGLAYAERGADLMVFELGTGGDPPVLLGVHDPMLHSIDGATVAGDRLYLVSWLDGLYVLDVVDPVSPVEMGSYPADATFHPVDVTVRGERAYLATSGGLSVFDVSAPVAPALLSTSSLGPCQQIAVAGRYAYLSCDSGLRTVDVADDLAPVEVGAYLPASDITRFGVSGGFVYLVQGSTIDVVDVTTASAPMLVESFELRDVATDLALAGANVLVGTWESGVVILETSRVFSDGLESSDLSAWDAHQP